ncbi:amino acid ABC transporter substrate-binding protein [Deinococcus aquiradiocola]|uniref:Amino acid ABC transporter substrate-binding protein n=1 Tax=Deinococcus aquiradiocola TaxID=393059 RepID=A0A917UPZ2_9DEIO|nr:amino acid ABC transporter substrate-binding protein [Deinococcus aquiradiocola]
MAHPRSFLPARPSSHRVRSLACAALLAALTAGPCTQAADLGSLQSSGTFRFGFATPKEPLLSGEPGDVRGFVTDLLGLIALQLKVNRTSWTRVATPAALVQGLQAGKFDAVVDTQLPRPLGGVNLSRPLACDGGVILSRPGGPLHEEDLKGKRVAVVTGSAYYYYVRNLPFDKKISVFADDTQALVGFLSGNIDALVTDRYDALRMLMKTGGNRIQVGPLLWSQDIDLVVTQNDNKEVIAGVDQALKSLMTDGTYRKLSLKYFGQDVRCTL